MNGFGFLAITIMLIVISRDLRGIREELARLRRMVP